MIDFTKLNTDEVVQYLIDHFDEIEVGHPVITLCSTLKNGIVDGSIVIETQTNAFAIIARANRKHLPPMDVIKINPQADLMFLFVEPNSRGSGVGKKFVADVKAKYMEGQAMVLVCAGDKRRRFFESSGFRDLGINDDGHFVMVCDSN